MAKNRFVAILSTPPVMVVSQLAAWSAKALDSTARAFGVHFKITQVN
jgi:hypothetical protein